MSHSQMSRSQMSHSQKNPFVGRVVHDRYRILGVLGEGGMGTVYEAEHVKIGRRVALKTLLPSLAENPHLLARFHREARAASTIGHPSIVDVTDMGEMPDGAPFLVMEKLTGEELADFAEREGPLRVQEMVRILRHVCSALHAAHEAGIVHRDLKPSNIFLVDQPDGPPLPKVLDFGISKFDLDPNDQGLTATGVAVGTPAFMSPEQAQGLKSVDRRTDVYAMGVIAYQLLTGRLPFSAKSYAALLIAILTVDPKPVGSLREDLPPELSAAIMRALRRDAAERFATIAEFADALKPFASHDDTPVVVPAASPPPREHTAVLASNEQVDAASPTTPATPAASMRAASTPAAHLSPPMQRPPKLLWGVGAAVVLAGLAIAWLSTRPAPSPHSPAPPPAATAPEPTPTEVEALPAGEDPPPSEVRVRIRVSPSEARIYLDDVAYPNPMDAPQPRSLTPTALRAEAPGYRTLERVVILDADQTFDFELAPERAPRRARPAPPRAETTPDPSSSTEADDGVYRGQRGGLRREL